MIEIQTVNQLLNERARGIKKDRSLPEGVSLEEYIDQEKNDPREYFQTIRYINEQLVQMGRPKLPFYPHVKHLEREGD